MDQPVEVGLVFPRSGQKVFVNIASSTAQRLQSQYLEHKPQSPGCSARAIILTNSQYGDNTRHA